MAAHEITLDFERGERIGFDEAILCQGKTPEHLAHILTQANARGARFLLTRLTREHHDALPAELRSALDFEPVSRTAYFGAPKEATGPARVAIVSAGTSDAFVAREVERTLRFSGHAATMVGDVGVAGLHRLTGRIDEIRSHPVVVAVAGMDAAIATVLGGLYGGALIAVPTSTGYGVAAGGTTALHSMLASCAPGVAVVNIDNGYGAACAAMRVLRGLK